MNSIIISFMIMRQSQIVDLNRVTVINDDDKPIQKNAVARIQSVEQ